MTNPQDMLKAQVREEQIRMTRLRLRVDLTAYRLGHTSLTRDEALALIERTRDEILELFPGKGEVFDLVLRPRFLRILNERALAEWGVVDSIN
ncbi:MAG: hypothetical protein HY581_05275 [Nitrospirae bacterium]|nr:hypothetical protein [Nitrospirota bacterium]